MNVSVISRAREEDLMTYKNECVCHDDSLSQSSRYHEGNARQCTSQ